MKSPSIKRVGIALAALLTFQCLFAPDRTRRIAVAQTDVAMITQLGGSVQLRRGGKTRPIRQTTLLNAGDVVRAGDDGRAVIYQAYAPVTRIGAGQSRTISRLSPPAPRNALKPEEFARLKRHYLNAKQRRAEPSPATMGGPDEAVLTLLEPRNSVVLKRRPTFTWTPVSGATNYLINVYDHHEKTVWTANTTEALVTYPEELSPLAPGNYKWEVTVQIGARTTDNPALYDATAFTVVSAERAAEIESSLASARASAPADDGAANLIYISALIEHKLLPQAAAELKRGLERAPRDQTLWELVMETYAQMKLWGGREDARRISDNANPTAEMVRTLEPRR